MKNRSLKFVMLFICMFFFVTCENVTVNREYYDSGVVKVEERLNSVKEVISRQEYYENGNLSVKASFYNGVLDGLVKKYSLVGHVEVEIEYDMGEMVGFIRYDSLGNKDYWFKSIAKSDIPVFKDEFIQIVGYNDSGIAVDLSVPGISPFQISPVTKNANWKSIDIKNGDWLLLPKRDSIEVGIGIKMTDSTFSFMGYFKPIVISELH